MTAQHRFAFAAQVHQALAAAERGLRLAQEAQNQLLGLCRVDRAVGLLLGPARARHEQQFGVRPDGLLVGLRRLIARHGGARRGSSDADLLPRPPLRPVRSTGPRSRDRAARSRDAATRVSTASMRWR